MPRTKNQECVYPKPREESHSILEPWSGSEARHWTHYYTGLNSVSVKWNDKPTPKRWFLGRVAFMLFYRSYFVYVAERSKIWTHAHISLTPKHNSIAWLPARAVVCPC